MTLSPSRSYSLPPSPPGANGAPSPLDLDQTGSDPNILPPRSNSAMMSPMEREPHRRMSSGPSSRGSSSPTKEKPRAKVQLEDFELIRVLGRGCAGRVLLVRHSRQNTVHAMKAISQRSVLASDELAHILTELDILKRLTTSEPHNSFVTRLNFSFTDRENFYFVMDFYPGGDLATQLEIYGTLGSVRTRFYAADLVMGLEDLHRHGVILRDLKPENILLNRKGHCVLADFGLSKEFPYRGDPQPLAVPQYEGEMVLPHWAGQGMGSVRLSPGGVPRVVVDRAWSFVGTTEYLAPEVVKGQDYSYPVDWWGLGCILFECLLGRVPFRTDDEESAQVLYNRICYEPWDWMLDDPKFRRKRDSELDAVTEGFLDALLQKDPMRRLTEPCIRTHYYFSHVDWDFVRGGDYSDPHPLHLHPLAEYNTRYFPKLCLEQDPNVDMSTHNPDEADGPATDYGRKLTALNDENTYKFEQLKYRKELEGFYWCREEEGWMAGVEEDEEVEIESEGPVGSEPESESYGSSSVESELPEPVNGDAESLVSTEVDEEAGDMEMESGEGQDGEVTIKVDDHMVVEPIPPPPATTTPKLAPVALSGAMSSMQLGSPVASPERLITPDTSSGDIPIRIREASDPSPSPEKIEVEPTPDKAEQAISAHPVPTFPSPVPAPLPLPPTILEPPVASKPIAAINKPIASIPIPLLRPKSEVPPRLPSGLPASGLSVSDIVSVPSPSMDIPARLIRRHPQLTSIDSVPAARLSIDLHGTITQLGEDDWEALEGDETIPSAPNGYGPNVPPSSFLQRLRRRPSNLMGSGLRRNAQARSTSDSSREGSPTKLSGPMFGKKALGKLKMFPLLRSRRNSEDTSGQPNAAEARESSVSVSTSASPPSRKSSPRLRLSRPEAVTRRHTESGWFERKISGRYFRKEKDKEKDRRSLTQSSEGSNGAGSNGMGWDSASATEGMMLGKPAGPPRVELKAMGSPVDWEFKLPALPLYKSVPVVNVGTNGKE